SSAGCADARLIPPAGATACLSSNLQVPRSKMPLFSAYYDGGQNDRYYTQFIDGRRGACPAGFAAEPRQGVQSADHDPVLRHPRRRAAVRRLQHLRRHRRHRHAGHRLPALVLLFVALLFSLGFEFVNGFHDTANAAATEIYTHSLPAEFAVMWSGFFNFLGVLLSSGAVAFGIVSLLPVELILQVGSSAGFAMVFALLIAAIIWNLGTWYFGL